MAGDALDLALALHAAPVRLAEWRGRRLPESGIAQVLRIALAQPDALDEAGKAFPGDAHRLVDAARFFVEQLMLAREFEHDPWRVLGVHPGSPPERIRAHHHLLVRLVHPDRSDDWANAYSDRVNRAWRRLRQDGGLNGGGSAAIAAEPWPEIVGQHRVGGIGATVPSPARPTHRRQARRFAAAIAASAAVTTVVVLTMPGPRPTAHSELPASADSEIHPAWYATPSPPELAAPAQPPLPAIVPLATLQPTDQSDSEPPRQSTSDLPLVTPPPSRSKPVAKVTVANESTEPTSSGTLSRPLPQPEPAISAARSTPTPSVTEPTPPAALPQRRSPEDTGRVLLHRFRERYVAGDLGGIMGLYARDIHADPKVVARLANAYAQAFRDSQQRYIAFSGVSWQQQGTHWLGRGHFESGYRRLPSLRKFHDEGIVELEWVQERDEPRLLRFDLRED